MPDMAGRLDFTELGRIAQAAKVRIVVTMEQERPGVQGHPMALDAMIRRLNELYGRDRRTA